MFMQRIAELVRRAAKDTGVIAALRNDPGQLTKALDLTEEHLNALHSASAFNAALAAPQAAAKSLTLPQAAIPVAPVAGVLLPPEGSGGGPAALTLPPIMPVAPVAPPPVAAPVVAPVAAPKAAPVAPVAHPPTPAPVEHVAPHGDDGQHDDEPQPVPAGLPNLTSLVAGCDGDCSAAITAVVANVSMTAHTALTALVAMASE